ncbi:FecCD family ABC transporter permease [Pedobacter metabolipauper]|uniref:Iron complex transport system permease protein n=1 Tax=Pedobacter metabolipauper TaxID=425513 RepID=A0A4V6PW14_9SPHI|nr:iron ABC transporter permease [Pedobacter metabolipauper]TDQ09777.1 iron complex transport system permease protein [Pedobacter metabolipauper]
MKRKFIYIFLILSLLVSICFSLAMGAMEIPIKEVLLILGTKLGICSQVSEPQYETVLNLVRLPRVALGLLVGAALGISGAAIQGIFRNPLAEPGLIGISAGASLMAVLVIVLEVTVLSTLSSIVGYYLVAMGAFLGAAVSAALVYHLSKSEGRPNVATMLLAGIAINALCGALTGLITANADEQQLRTITFWMLGSLAGATWQTLFSVLPFILIPLALLPGQGRKLNAFVLGEKQADQLGMRTSRVKLRVVILCTMAVGASVAVSGIIGFVGLLVPHMVRLLGGVDNRYVLPASALMGALVLCLSDLLARMLTAPMEQPIGVITALIGSPVFLYILIKDKNAKS